MKAHCSVVQLVPPRLFLSSSIVISPCLRGSSPRSSGNIRSVDLSRFATCQSWAMEPVNYNTNDSDCSNLLLSISNLPRTTPVWNKHQQPHLKNMKFPTGVPAAMTESPERREYIHLFIFSSVVLATRSRSICKPSKFSPNLQVRSYPMPMRT